MQKVFFPTTSLNFGNIFSSESISPEIFYSNRGFGFDYFFNLFPNFKNHLLFFDKFPEFDLENSDETESYKIVFELNLSEDLIPTEESGVFLFSSTLYLNLENLVNVHFFSKDEQIKIIAKAESSKSLKTLNKYISKFDTESHKSLEKQRFMADLPNPKQPEDFEIEIKRDRFFNNFKGFFYGFLAGQSYKKSDQEISFFKSFQNIKNDFALLKNKLDHNSLNFSSNKKSFYYNNTNIKYIDQLISDIYRELDKAEEIFQTYIEKFDEDDYRTKYVEEVLAKDYKSLLGKELIGFVNFISKLMKFEVDLEKKSIKWFLDQNPNNPRTLFNLIRQNIFIYKSAKEKELREEADSEILKASFKIEKYATQRFLERTSNQEINFSKIYFNSIFEPVKVENETLDEHFEKIINILITNAKIGKGKTNDTLLLPIVEKVGDIFGEGKGRNSKLFKYLSRKEINYFENPESPNIFKNFTAFIFNANEIEKLQKYLDEKSIELPFYAFSFYGAYNGFASLSKSFTNPVFDKPQIQKQIDLYLNDINKKLQGVIEFPVLEEIISPIDENLPSFETIVAYNNNFEFDNVIVNNSDINQERNKIDIEELRNNLLYCAKLEKIKITAEQLKAIDKSLAEINSNIDFFKISYKAQKSFVKGQLKLLLTTRNKVPKFGEKSVNKICELIE